MKKMGIYCDLCGREIHSGGSTNFIKLDGLEYDLCDRCSNNLKDFMNKSSIDNGMNAPFPSRLGE